ncbi:hypothetical protein [Thioalkalivibrio halophilus]|uniref:Uncharacterized protein n=1 Tax=Thioalkalivibrio halophilus TaxID=252474 RepID=A0A1V2ZZP8_9GAMM|nr:hypothetical protein [Thioalkalivibrio halophilus]OOC10587.1 hypothetical protein B1A74_04715 [Thioalkalivibrio halophilus]
MQTQNTPRRGKTGNGAGLGAPVYRNTGRRWPPYARQHADALRRPVCTVWVAVGADAWRWARSRPNHHVLVAPEDTDPASLDWRCCRGHDPVLLQRVGHVDGERVERLVRALLRDGVQRVLTDTGDRYLAEGVDHG